MEVVVSGIGAVSALGRGTQALWDAAVAGRDGIETIRRFDTGCLDVHIAGLVPDRNEASFGERAAFEICVEYGVEAAREALAAAGLDGAFREPSRVGLVVGSCLGEHARPLYEMTVAVGDALGVRGPRLTVSTACASSTNALGIAKGLLDRGALDVVIAGGADALTSMMFAGFHALGVLSTQKCAPFSEPAGTTLGEGAGFVVLERSTDAAARGAPIVARLLGYGLSSDAFHETSPDPTGAGVARALAGALADAGVRGEDVGYVNAHGTGTGPNDAAEWRALQRVLGRHAPRVPVSSSKSFFGHAQGAAGILEIILTLMAMERGLVPQTLGFVGARPNAPTDCVGQKTPRTHPYDIAISTNSAFGGANCAVVLGRSGAIAAPERSGGSAIEQLPQGAAKSQAPRGVRGGASERPPGVMTNPVYLRGAAVIGEGGTARDFALDAVLSSADPAGLDPMTRYLTGAAALALEDAGIRVRSSMRDRTGLVGGATRVSSESVTALLESIDERGLRFLSAPLFARMVLNASTGACARMLSLRGPLSTISAGDATGLFAIVHAAHLLAHREDADVIVAGGVDELEPRAQPSNGDGAACLVLARSGAKSQAAGFRILGTGVAGPTSLAHAVRDALAESGLALSGIDRVFGARLDACEVPHDEAELPHAQASGSARAAAQAFFALRSGDARRVLVCARDAGALSCAMVVAREDGGPSERS